MHIPAALLAAALLGFFVPVKAQETKAPGAVPLYKVKFNIRGGIDGKSPALHYSMLIDESRRAAFQATSRVQYDSGSPQYVDVGTNIEVGVHASDGKVMLDGVIELSSITGQVNIGAITEPIVGQRKMAFNTAVVLATPTMIVDDRKASGAVTPNAEMRQVEAVVTRVN
jgi:hypothetical protein